LRTAEAKDVRLADGFWKKKQDIVFEKTLLSQWKILNGEIEVPGYGRSYCVENFRIAAGEAKGEYKGLWFSDHDVAKWMEGAAYSLFYRKNAEIESALDYMTALMEKVQDESGYINTYYQLNNKKRWSSFAVGHELLCAGNIIEAAIVLDKAVGKDRLLKVAVKLADCICDMVEKSEKDVYDGHEQIEISFMRLYRHTGNGRYLDVASRFILTRGRDRCPFLDEPLFSFEPLFTGQPLFPLTYYQAHKPVMEQDEAVGHAVRAAYLYTAMAELADLRGDADMKAAADRLWRNICDKKLYINGAIGSEHYGERFTEAYDLPGDLAYNETCASIGLMMFARGLMKSKPMGEAADILEKSLINSVLSSVSADGDKYFYVNPLSIKPAAAEFRGDMNNTFTERQAWLFCPCCPPNYARLMASLAEYIYLYDDKNIYVNLFISNDASFALNGKTAKLQMRCSEPYGEKIEIFAETDIPAQIHVKKPYWALKYTALYNGKKITAQEKDGYLILPPMKKGETAAVNFDVRPRFVFGNENIEDTACKTAVEKGYVLFCAEEIDNGKLLHNIIVDTDSKIEDESGADGYHSVFLKAKRFETESDKLYSFDSPNSRPVRLRLIPYYAWNNRGKGEMSVWQKTFIRND
jgi:DUF1680 family protein